MRLKYEYVRHLNTNLLKKCTLLKYHYAYFKVKTLCYVDVEVKFPFIVH